MEDDEGSDQNLDLSSRFLAVLTCMSSKSSNTVEPPKLEVLRIRGLFRIISSLNYREVYIKI